MEKSPPRSYKKQQKIEKNNKNYSRKEKRKKKLKVSNINQSLSTTRKKVDRKLCKNLKIEKQHQLGFGEPN